MSFDFAVVGNKSTPNQIYKTLVDQYKSLGETIGAFAQNGIEHHDEGVIAQFIVGLMFVLADNPPKSQAVYTYIRQAVGENESLTELASRIIVLYDLEIKKRDTSIEAANVRDAIQRVRLD